MNKKLKNIIKVSCGALIIGAIFVGIGYLCGAQKIIYFNGKEFTISKSSTEVIQNNNAIGILSDNGKP